MPLLPPVHRGDWIAINQNFAKVNAKLDETAAVRHYSLSVEELTLENFTQGSVLFVNASKQIAEDNDKLFWDLANFRLGIGTASPGEMLDVKGTGVLYALKIYEPGEAAFIYLYDQDAEESLNFQMSNTHGYMSVVGTNPGSFFLQYSGLGNLILFAGVTEGLTPAFALKGYKTGDALRQFAAKISPDENDTVLFYDVNNFRFDGTVLATSFTDDTATLTGGELLDLTTIEATTTLGIEIGDVQQLNLTDGKLAPTTDSDIDLGDATHYFKDAYIDSITASGTVTVDNLIATTSVSTDLINEISGSGNGVTIDSVLLKDNAVTADTVTASTFSVDAATSNHSILDVFDDLTFYNTNTAKDIKFFTQIGEVSNLTLQLEGATNKAIMTNAAITNLAATNIGAFNLTGKLTAGANEIEGSAFDINGGTLNGIDSGATIGTLTLADGSITDSGGAISFGDENLTTTGQAGIGTAVDSTATLRVQKAGTTCYRGAWLSSYYYGSSSPQAGAYCLSYGQNTATAAKSYGGDFYAIHLANSFENAPDGGYAQSAGGSFTARDNTGRTYTRTGTGYHILEASHFDIVNAAGNWTTNNPPVTTYMLHIEDTPTGYGSNHTHWAIYSAGGDSSHAGDFRIGSNVAPTVALDVTGAAKIGDGTNELQVSSTGDVIFAGTAGLAFAEIYISDNDVAQTIGTGATYTKLTGTATNGVSNNCTADGANTKITITKAGIYKISAHFDGKSDTANVEFEGAIFVDGTIQNNCRCKVEFIAADKNCSSSIVGLLDVAATKDIDFRVRHDNGGDVDLTIGSANISVIQIGGT